MLQQKQHLRYGQFHWPAALFSMVLLAWPTFFSGLEKKAENQLSEILTKIYHEMKEFNLSPDEGFLRGDFFIGTDDDDDTYKDTHVSILVQDVQNQKKMKIQLTEMEPAKENRRVKYAGRSRTIGCLIEGDRVSTVSSDYLEKEMRRLAEGILRAVRAKKKLLNLYGSGRQG